MWPALLSLTTFLTLANSSINVKQNVKSSSETKSSIHVESRVQNGESRVNVEITGVPSPQITVVEGGGQAKVNVETQLGSGSIAPASDDSGVQSKISEKVVAKAQRNSLGNVLSRIISRIVELIFTLFGIR